MENRNSYKIEVKWYRDNPKTKAKELVRLPQPKSTGISWEELVKIIAEKGMEIVNQIRLHNVGQSGGTNMLGRNELLQLWKEVEFYRKKRAN
jgi:anaerobic selenocysteine-containing dehydrogenase